MDSTHPESQHRGKQLIRETLIKEGIRFAQLTIHSDLGPAMRSQDVAQLLATLAATKYHIRPHVSDDKPISESPFKTLKYRLEFPDCVASYDHGLDVCRWIFRWHNEQHQHLRIGLLTPAVVHAGQTTAVLEGRAYVLAVAGGVPWPIGPASEVWINPPENRPTAHTRALPRDSKCVPQFSHSHRHVLETCPAPHELGCRGSRGQASCGPGASGVFMAMIGFPVGRGGPDPRSPSPDCAEVFRPSVHVR